MANQFLALSLFVMLLSFFIILNGLASFEDVKAKPVLNSVATTFSARDTVIEDATPPAIIESTANSTREGDTLAQLQAFFEANIAGIDVERNRLGTVMHVSMPLKKFQNGIILPNPQAERRREEAGGFMLPTLISLMHARESAPYDMDIILNLETDPAQAAANKPEALKDSLQTISRIAQTLEDEGFPEDLLTAGLGKGRAGYVDLYFRRHEALAPSPPSPLTEEVRP
ncbi:MAG: hypothetical protein KDJ75_05800 [Alphaproteobacteria bacterium]|nr:hypothetical protein [Alphaproteobacteria bacterium]